MIGLRSIRLGRKKPVTTVSTGTGGGVAANNILLESGADLLREDALTTIDLEV